MSHPNPVHALEDLERRVSRIETYLADQTSRETDRDPSAETDREGDGRTRPHPERTPPR